MNRKKKEPVVLKDNQVLFYVKGTHNKRGNP